MTAKRARVEAARRTLEGERIRWLLGKKGQLTSEGNVFGEKITEPRYDFVVQKAAAVELERNMLLIQMENGPKTVHELHDATGISKPEIVRHLIAMKKWRLIELAGIEGQSPRYAAIPRKEPKAGEVS